MVHNGNRAMDTGETTAQQAAGAQAVLAELDRVLGVLVGDAEGPADDILALAQQRQAARRDKNWAEADRLRDEVAARGWEILVSSQENPVKL